MWITSSLETVLTPTAVALGNFDGLHRGHQRVVQPILNSPTTPSTVAPHQGSKVLLAQPQFPPSVSAPVPSNPATVSASDTEAAQRCYGTVVTFYPHPRTFFTGEAKPLLTPIDEKVDMLRKLGADQLVLLPFNQALAALTPEQFVEQILIQQLQARRISVGFDFQFGKGRAGNVVDLQKIAARSGVEVIIVPRYSCDQGDRISSSLIRQALQQGEIERANHLLGRPYVLQGSVVKGQQLGRTLGFPTANLQLPAEKFLPRFGVYAVWVTLPTVPTTMTSPSPVMGVMNIGCRPTVEGEQVTVEVHLLHWSGDLYGQLVSVELIDFLRPEHQFPSVEQLKTQIQADCVRAVEVLQRSQFSGTAD